MAPQQHIVFHDLDPDEVMHGDHLRVARVKGVYWHHGFACSYKDLKQYMDVINVMRTNRKREPIDGTAYKDKDILIVEQNRDPEGLCVVTIPEFRMGATLRIVKYNVSALEYTLKMSGSTYTQRALSIDESTDRAIGELLEQHKLEASDNGKTHWEYHLVSRNCETFVLYCKGVIGKEQQYSDQVAGALCLVKSVGALTVNKTITMGMIGRIKAATVQIYIFAKSIASGATIRDAGQLAAGVSDICSHLVACGIGSAIQFAIEVTVNLVRWLLRIWEKYHWLAISTKTFLQEMLKSISRCIFSFGGSLIGMLAGAPGGPLSIITAVLGSILGSYFGHKFMTMFLGWRERRVLEVEDEEESKKLLEVSTKEDMVVFHDVLDGSDVVMHQIVEGDWVLI